MAETVLINTSEIGNDISKGLADIFLNKLSPLITIFKFISIAIFVYILFLIIRSLFRWKSYRNISKIEQNVEEINEKMNLLVKKLEKYPQGKEEIKETEKEKSFFRRLSSMFSSNTKKIKIKK